jgi:G3E family GTPase
MLREKGQFILRLKGLLNLKGLDHPVAIHAVHHNLYPLDRLNAWANEDRRSRIVLIANDADSTEIGQFLVPPDRT